MKEKIIAVLLVWVTCSSVSCLMAQDKKKPSRQSSMEAFSRGNYDQAYDEFRQLLVSYPKDPLYRYYSAVCLVKLEKNPGEASNLLTGAMEGSSVKSLPGDALFFLGRARQMQGDFKGAVEAYEQYTSKAGKKAAKDMNVPEYISQCRSGKGKIAGQAAETASGNAPPVTSTASSAGNVINVQKQNVPAEMDMKLGDALEAQYKADSVKTAAALLKAQQDASREKITGATTSDSTKSNLLRQPAAGSASAQVIQNSLKNQDETRNMKTDSVNKASSGNAPAAVKKQAVVDTLRKELKSVTKQLAGIFTVFEVLPKPVTDPKVRIDINPEVPDGLVYRIQAAVFKNPVNPSFFKGLTPVYGFRSSNSGVTTYYIGMFRKAADASRALTAVRTKGFRDAFIVPMTGNKAVSSDRAAVLEKEWGGKPLFTITTTQDVMPDTIPPTLVFRVEIARTAMPFREDVIENMKRIAGRRGLDAEPLPGGGTAYITGNFITFESAEEYADLLVRNGFREAKVVARLGKKEIDVETAKQLFENLR